MRALIDILARGLTLMLVLALASGCYSSPRRVLAQGQGPTMDEILQSGGAPDHTSLRALDTELQDQLIQSENASQRLYPRYESYTRSSLNEINQLFPRHRNPQITLYVHPHLSTGDNAPVPGYTTAFNLYASDEYALPSEVPPAYYPPRVPNARTEPELEPEYVRSGSARQSTDAPR